ncbi:hypothetical protein BDF22DRAFT_676038 [Syncephalis plumigaleata]|nr:hypothetical protein BDF22DRAFT_676038 [Syncephalis plumigaleata]
MYSSNWYRLIILLVTIILPWLDVVLAKVTFSGSDEDVNYPSADFFPLSSSDHYSGVALKWNYEHDHHHDGPSCFFPSVNASDPYIMRFAYALSKHRNIALLISYQMSMAASCKGKEQVNRSMDILFEQLEEAGLPSVSALILSPGHGEHSMLRDDYIRYNYVDPFSESIQKHELAVSVIKTDDIPHKYGNVASDYITYEIAIEHEPNHINGPYLPARMIAYKWILFAITFLMLSYTWARIVNLIRMQELRWNALSASFFVTSIGCILLLVYLISLCGPNTTRILVYIYSFLSRISFNLVLWHWSTIGKNLFTKNPIILFRIIVIIWITIHVILMLFVFDQSTSTPYEFYLLHSYNSVISIIALLMTWKHIIIFGGLVLFWFSWNAHNLNKHPKGRTRFIKVVKTHNDGYSSIDNLVTFQ